MLGLTSAGSIWQISETNQAANVNQYVPSCTIHHRTQFILYIYHILCNFVGHRLHRYFTTNPKLVGTWEMWH